MSNFMPDNFLLTCDTAEELYGRARNLPIFDYHCHLDPRDICEDKNFGDLSRLWLKSDHYKWRMMRACGIDERLITGDATPYEKFAAFAEALPYFIGNPVYHWTHMELKRYFSVCEPLNPVTAPSIWEKASAAIAADGFTPRGLIKNSGVRTVITTDDPCSDLEWHRSFRDERECFSMLPCFRVDKLTDAGNPRFGEYIKELSACAGIHIYDFASLCEAIARRLDFFVRNGCVSADVSFASFPEPSDLSSADACVRSALSDISVGSREKEAYSFALLSALGRMLSERDMAMQLHVGVERNLNRKLFSASGRDSGGDSVGSASDVRAAAALFNEIQNHTKLPKTILYTLNPCDYYPFATLLNDFAGGSKGRLQLGAAWWFLDSREGIIRQLKTFATTGGLGYFNGMLTDSRSFLSYARHDYFRRILCSFVGEAVERGEYPDDSDALDKLIRDICYFNAETFFRREA